mgnify:FL=1
MKQNYANFGVRLVPAIIDAVAVSVVSGVLKSIIASTLIGFGYYVFFIGHRGQTLGKMAMKIKVVDMTTGNAPGYLKAFLREVVGKIISGIALSLGYLWMLWDKDKQTWHDKIASTVVVKE